MSFWKKLYKKLKKIQKTDPNKLEQDKYLDKLQKQINRITDNTDQSKK